MPRIELKIKPPEQFERFSTKYPDDEFSVLASYHIEDGLCVLMKAETTTPKPSSKTSKHR